ncbi:cytochrome P450 [Actinacidiphila soli]|uniref:cytochrome P450 n=1 Tax=Actinacidiphila soli TaxID=2487275 RepID=UPI000FCA5279|nr:cytochrome P450 [Actinacidiphila soli]
MSQKLLLSIPSAPTLDARATAGLVRRWRHVSDPRNLAVVYDELRAAGPLVPTPWRALLVTGYDDCRQVLAERNWRTLSASWRDRHRPGWRDSPSTAGLCETPLQQDPPEHTARRRPLAAALTPRVVADLAASVVEPLADEYVSDFAARVRREGSADIVGAVCRPLPTAVLAGLLGLPAAVDQAWLTAESLAMVRVEELASPPSVVRRADQAAEAQLACYERILADRRRRPTGDLLSRWAADDPEGARYLLLTLFSAGVPTTAALLAGLAQALATLPGLAARIGREPDFADRLVDEMLRWDPPGRVVTRVAGADTELGGRPLPGGQIVHALIGAAHRDPELFADPHTFDPDRPPQRLLAYGSGLHYCLGALLARAQATAFMRGFARELPGARLAAPPVRQPGPSMADITRLPIAL